MSLLTGRQLPQGQEWKAKGLAPPVSQHQPQSWQAYAFVTVVCRYCIYNISFTLIKYTHTFTDVSYPALATVLGFAAFNSVAILSFILINHGDRDLHLMHAFSSLREQREVNAKHGMAPAAMRS